MQAESAAFAKCIRWCSAPARLFEGGQALLCSRSSRGSNDPLRCMALLGPPCAPWLSEMCLSQHRLTAQRVGYFILLLQQVMCSVWSWCVCCRWPSGVWCCLRCAAVGMAHLCWMPATPRGAAATARYVAMQLHMSHYWRGCWQEWVLNDADTVKQGANHCRMLRITDRFEGCSLAVNAWVVHEQPAQGPDSS